MDKFTGTNLVINHKTKGKSSHIKKNLLRNTSMFSTCSSIIYYKRVTMNNSIDVNSDLPVKSPALFNEMEQEKVLHLSKVIEITSNMRPQGRYNEASSIQANHSGHVSLNKTCGEAPCNDNNNVINIQIPYDLNTLIEPKLWSENFHSISLYSSIEQIASDTKSIKDSPRYITNKKVNPKTANDLKDFDSIGDMVWNFISSVYQSGWDSLYTDNKSKFHQNLLLKSFPLQLRNPTSQSPN